MTESTQDVEALVRHAYEQLWTNDDIDALLELADEDIVFRTSGAFPDMQAEYRGHAGVRRYWETIRSPFERLAIEVARVVEVGEHVLILFRFRARSRDGLELDAAFGQVCRMHEGKVTELTAYPSGDEAAAALGLSLDEL
jgi:ketosteroid isomerase-like protein